MLRPVTVRNLSPSTITFAGSELESHGVMYLSLADYVAFATTTDVSKFDVSVTLPTVDLVHASVKDYGAVGDGVSNDTYAIQRAIDSVADNGGGVVTVPVGIYLVTGLLLHDGVSLEGESRIGSVIRQASGSGSACISTMGDTVSLTSLTIRGA